MIRDRAEKFMESIHKQDLETALKRGFSTKRNTRGYGAGDGGSAQDHLKKIGRLCDTNEPLIALQARPTTTTITTTITNHHHHHHHHHHHPHHVAKSVSNQSVSNLLQVNVQNAAFIRHQDQSGDPYPDIDSFAAGGGGFGKVVANVTLRQKAHVIRMIPPSLESVLRLIHSSDTITLDS